MEIEYEFEMNDWMEFQKNYLHNSKQFIRTKIIVAAMLPIIFSIIATLELLKGKINPIGLVLFGVVSILWITFSPKILYKRTLVKTKKMIEEGDNTGILGQHKLTLNDEGITHKEPESEQKITWNGIKKLKESDTHYFLYNTAISAIIIPKKKVHSDIEKLDQMLKNNIN